MRYDFCKHVRLVREKYVLANGLMKELMILALLAFCIAGCAHPREVPANLLLITMDTTRADHLGCYGYSKPITPNLDRLAKRGVLFRNAMAHVPLTRPSHATILTGIYPQHLDLWSNGPYRLDPKFSTIAQQLPEMKSGAIVSSFVLASSFGLNHGFSYYDDSCSQSKGKSPEKNAGEALQAAVKWLDRISTRPFFLWVHFYDPHFPYEPPESFRQRFGDYDGEIAYMDESIGTLLKMLESKGILNKTLIVAVGDHGEGLGDHGEPTHGYYIYDSTMHVPLVMAGPGVPENKQFTGVVGLTDIAPTILDAFKRSIPQVDGRSLWNQLIDNRLLSRPAILENRTIYYQFGWARLVGLRTEDFLWVRSPIAEFYNISSDPAEHNNLAESEESRCAEMQKVAASIIPTDEKRKEGGALTPEEEEKLESLGYISASEEKEPPVDKAPDAKKFSSIVPAIESLIHKEEEGDLANAGSELKQILAVDPTNRFALGLQGKYLLESGNASAAVAELEKLRDASTNHPETMALLGQAYEKTGQTEKALQCYSEAAKPPWVYWPSLLSLARLSMQYPDFMPRTSVLQRLSSLTAESYEEYLGLAQAYAILGEWPQAEINFRSAYQRNHGSLEALVGLLQMLLKDGKAEEALSLADQVQPAVPETLLISANALISLGRKEDACSNYRKCLDLKPGNANVLSRLGFGLEQCGDTELATRAYRAALNSDPHQPQALFSLGRILAQERQWKEATADLQLFLKTAPSTLADQKLAAQKILAMIHEQKL